MPNPIVFPWWRAVRQRRDQVEALLAWAHDQHTDGLIVAGDMNASPTWPLYRQLGEQFDDLPRLAADSAGSSPERTWGWRPGWPRMLRIDHVFGRGINAVASSVHSIPGSDHHAVVVEIADY
jgi:endonuclease/exonuclease/phosphatase family metal-dependent hydrolase